MVGVCFLMRWWLGLWVVGCGPAATSVSVTEPVRVEGSLRVMAPLAELTQVLPRQDVVARTKGRGTAIALLQGEGLTWITQGAHHDVDPVLVPPTPDEPGRIIFSSDRAGSYDLWTIGLDGRGLTRLTHDAATDERHPDVGQVAYELMFAAQEGGPERRLARYHKVVFESCRADACRIETMTDRGWFRVAVDGMATQSCRRPTFAAHGHELAVECSNGARLVHFASSIFPRLANAGPAAATPLPAHPTVDDIRPRIIPNVGTSEVPIGTYADFRAPRPSPNGVWLLAERTDESGDALWLVRRDSLVRHRLTDGGHPRDAHWIDERTIAFDDRDGAQRYAASVGIAGADVANLWAYPRLWGIGDNSPLYHHGIAVFEGEAANYGPWFSPDDGVGMPGWAAEAHRVPLISADAVLDLMSMLLSQAITTIEEHELQPALPRLCRQMESRARRAAKPELATFFAVAAALADRDTISVVPSDRPEVAETLGVLSTAIEQSTALPLPRVGISQYDPSRFIVRGHYDRAGRRGFFRAMVWLSTMPLGLRGSLDAAKLGWPAMSSSIAAVWKELSGPPATPTPADVLDAFKQRPTKSDAEHHHTLATEMPIPELDLAYVALPAGATPDAGWTSRAGPAPDPAPDPLLVMAHLGASRAVTHGAPRASVWSGGESLHERWLMALKGLVAPLQKGSWPAYASTHAHRDKLLSTASAGYVQLLHHTVLSRHPPRVRMGGTLLDDARVFERRLDEPPQTQVEPVPQFFAAMAEVVDALVELLDEPSLRSPTARPALDDLKGRLVDTKDTVLAPLQRALAFVRRGERHDSELERKLRDIAELTQGRFSSHGMDGGLLGNVNPKPPCIITGWADLPMKLRALAVGKPQRMAVLVGEAPHRHVATAGAASFYIDDRKPNDRPTDADWCSRLDENGPPKPPDWTRSFRDSRRLGPD